MLDNRAIPDYVNIAECMNFPKIKAKGEVEDEGALFPYFLEVQISQCIAKWCLWHDAILARKEHYDVNAVYFSICTKSKSFEQWKII